ncbi:MAG: EF-P beta-lysylation protein EpmB [Acidobacteriota bacterium]
MPAWQRALADDALRDVGALLARLGLTAAQVDAQTDPARLRAFPLRVPRAFVDRMRPGDPDDPLLRQVLPRAIEDAAVDGYGSDPLAEAPMSPRPGVIHKYRGRALLVLTGACAVHCRYCFRRHFPYGDHALSDDAWRGVVDQLRATPSLDEVIWSGGDPLSLRDVRLARYADDLAAIPHLRRLRVHTRLPIVEPSRIDDALLAWLTGTRLAPVMVLHANHARELDDAVAAACARLRAAGVVLLNQSVLLRGVNDDVEALAALSLRLFEIGVMPYYLHVLDRVAGAAHFALAGPSGTAADEDAIAEDLAGRLAARLPGYLVPRLVREVPDRPAKTLLRPRLP